VAFNEEVQIWEGAKSRRPGLALLRKYGGGRGDVY